MTDKTTPQDSAAMPPASAGSRGDAVGWILFHGDRMTFDVVFETRDEAEKYSRAYERKPDIVPVYRSPTLTDAEREAIDDAAEDAEIEADQRRREGEKVWASHYDDKARSLRAIIERLK